MSEKEERRVVTIRNIDEELYNKAMSLARSLGKTAGEIVNDALRLLVSSLETGAATAEIIGRSVGERVEEARQKLLSIISVGDLDELTVTNKDLKEIDKKIMFRNIGRLVFGEDVDPRVFEEKVAGIVYCDTLVIPENLPKLKVLSKARFIKKIEIRMGGRGEAQAG